MTADSEVPAELHVDASRSAPTPEWAEAIRKALD